MVDVVKFYLAEGLSVQDTATKTQYPIDFVKNCL